MDPILLGLLIGVPLLLAIGGYWYVRLRAPAEEPIYHFNCPKCQRRLRYRARQQGRNAMCPRCRNPITFPPVPLAKR